MAWKANGKAGLPLADRDRAWDAAAADGRVRTWAGGPDKEKISWAKYRQAFFACDPEVDGFGGVKLGFADVIDGELRAVPRGVFAAAGGRGVNAADLPEDVRADVRRRITAYYRQMARAFDDEGIQSPFEEAGRLPVAERKTVLEYRGEPDGRVVTGFPSVFGVLDDGGDIVTPGAYLKTLAERGQRLRWLWQHDSSQPPIAQIVEMAEVGAEALPAAVLTRWPEASGALMVKREYLDTPRGNEVLAGIRAGAINEMSIGYDAIRAKFPQDELQGGRPVRRILKEIRLWEMSDVLWGMNAATANLKELLAGRDRPGQVKAMAEWIESRIHLNFTEIADGLFGDGLLTREERIALSGLISEALNAFNAGMVSNPDLAGVRERERWEAPPAVAENDMARAEMMRRRVAVLRKRLALV